MACRIWPTGISVQKKISLIGGIPLKRTIYARLLALVVLISLFCTGCSARTPVTAEEFETQASAVGFTVETPSVDPETYVSARTAYDQTIDMQIDFVSSLYCLCSKLCTFLHRLICSN